MTKNIPVNAMYLPLNIFVYLMSTPVGVTFFYIGSIFYFLMIHYQKIFELHNEGISLRFITASTSNSHQKVTEVIRLGE